MNNQQNRDRANQADGVPAFFSFHNSIHVRNRVQIGEDPSRHLERDPVLALVNEVFVFVPRQKSCIYKNVTHSTGRAGIFPGFDVS